MDRLNAQVNRPFQTPCSLESRTPDDTYRLLCSVDDDPGGVIEEGREPQSWFSDQMDEIIEPLDALDRMTLADALSYLTDDILQKVDRAAMAVGLETRVPFLDKDVVEFSCRVPHDMKVRSGQGKWLVRQLLDRHVSRDLVDRPKPAFRFRWTRGYVVRSCNGLPTCYRLRISTSGAGLIQGG